MIFLTGFMGSGKTSVGNELARLKGVPFVDMDEEIEAITGSSIPDIFKYATEKAFRLIESDVLMEIVRSRENAVVATGGGVPTDPTNRALMKSSGIVVYLKADLETLKHRLGEDQTRPLWGPGVERLYIGRSPFYEKADVIINTDSLDIKQIAAKVLDSTMNMVSPIPFALSREPYPVYIGEGIFADFKAYLSRHASPEGIFVLVDENVYRLYQAYIKDALYGLNYHVKLVPASEEAKGMDFLMDVIDDMLSCPVNRYWITLAVGGGVTGDLAGFASSIILRGIPVVQVPTTLLAQVDAGLGGKTAINHERGKNLLGTFHQPMFVLSDTRFLQTLSPLEIKSAMAEVIKYGIIMDRPLFEYLEKGSPDLGQVVRMCTKDKAYVVARDEKEAGLRRILNFGHTIGHAVEKTSGFHLKHGQAVALGMLFAAWFSRDMDLISTRDYSRIQDLVMNYSILDGNFPLPSPEEIRDVLVVDKKAAQGGIWFVLTPEIGSVRVEKLSISKILDAYERFSDGYRSQLQRG